jgi:hypothetical protein
MSGEQYPIGQLLAELINEHGPTEVAFLERLGYRNIERGLRRLRLWTEGASGHEKILKQIAATFPEHAESLRSAVEETKRVRELEWELEFLNRCEAEADTFKPFVCARGSSPVPTQITFHGLTGGRLELVRVPEHVFELALDDQLAAMPRYLREYAKQFRGFVPFWGELRGFIYARLLDHFRFDREGNFVEHIDKPFRRGYSAVQLH